MSKSSKLQVFNTLTNTKEAFVPLNGDKVTIYACGPTVYDASHLGHARMTIVWDVIQRYLRYSGYDVTFVRNITDIDDKIINRAVKLKMTPEQLARRYTYEFWRDMYELNIHPPDFEPKATEFLPAMFKFVEGLIEKGHAYESRGDVYFRVSSFKEYGKLSKQSLDQLMVGARDQVRSQNELQDVKENAVDFALWKGAKEGEAGWSSPWGFGRPGWHLECSSMIKTVLGETIDIHGGGEDLVFPHHENEIAQSESLMGKPLARYWLHNSFVSANAEKMSKSLGNYETIQGLLKTYSSDVIRLYVLQTHYRNPIDFTPESIEAAKVGMNRLLRSIAVGEAYIQESIQAHTQALTPAESGASDGNGASTTSDANKPSSRNGDSESAEETTLGPVASGFLAQFEQAMDNDFNTAVAVSILFSLADAVFQASVPGKGEGKGGKQAAKKSAPDQNQTTAPVTVDIAALKPEGILELANLLKKLSKVLGLTLVDTRSDIDSSTARSIVDFTLELRQQARERKDYATSDLVRDRLLELGIQVMDGASGSTWKKS